MCVCIYINTEKIKVARSSSIVFPINKDEFNTFFNHLAY